MAMGGGGGCLGSTHRRPFRDRPACAPSLSANCGPRAGHARNYGVPPSSCLPQYVLAVAEPDAGSALAAASGIDSELVVGLVTPVGTNTEALASSVRASLSRWAYTSHVIKVSALMPPAPVPMGEPEDDRIRRLIAAGNLLCASEKDPAALARRVVGSIRRARVAQHRAEGATDNPAVLGGRPVRRRAYVVHSLKRVAEVMFLRELYGPQFVLLASQGTPAERERNLTDRALSVTGEDEAEAVARELMALDAVDEDPFGQQVNKTYPLADFFLRVSDSTRAIALLFGDPTVAPDPGEYAMFVAKSTAARSLAGSRKVGAVLVRDGRVVASGYNDVPAGQTPDIVAGRDTSEQFKRRNVEDTLRRLAREGLLAGAPSNPVTPETVDRALAALDGGELMSVIEYQRAVHAEAGALDDAAVRGVVTSRTDLYVTTFPCHLCYKQALSAGVAKIRYIEPYSKSRAREMYPQGSDERLLPYEGVAPRAYTRVFDDRPPPRSKAGAFRPVPPHESQPLLSQPRRAEDIDRDERLALRPTQKGTT